MLHAAYALRRLSSMFLGKNGQKISRSFVILKQRNAIQDDSATADASVEDLDVQ